MVQEKADKANNELAQKNEAFEKMGESLGLQAQDKAMLKMENMQMKQEMYAAQQEIKTLKNKR